MYLVSVCVCVRWCIIRLSVQPTLWRLGWDTCITFVTCPDATLVRTFFRVQLAPWFAVVLCTTFTIVVCERSDTVRCSISTPRLFRITSTMKNPLKGVVWGVVRGVFKCVVRMVGSPLRLVQVNSRCMFVV